MRGVETEQDWLKSVAQRIQQFKKLPFFFSPLFFRLQFVSFLVWTGHSVLEPRCFPEPSGFLSLCLPVQQLQDIRYTVGGKITNKVLNTALPLLLLDTALKDCLYFWLNWTDCMKLLHPSKQPSNHPINNPTIRKQPTNPPSNQLTNQPTNQPTLNSQYPAYLNIFYWLFPRWKRGSNHLEI